MATRTIRSVAVTAPRASRSISRSGARDVRRGSQVVVVIACCFVFLTSAAAESQGRLMPQLRQQHGNSSLLESSLWDPSLWGGSGADGRGRSLAGKGMAKSNAVCDYRKGSWVHISKIPGYKVPYAANCSHGFSCPLPSTRMQPPYNYVWVPAPPCNYYKWKFNAKLFLKKQRNTVLAFVGDSLNDNLYDAVVCMLKAQTRVVFKKMKFGARTLGHMHAPNYNLSLLSVNSGYLVQSPRYYTNPKAIKYVMNPKWESLLPYTNAIIFTAGHWFFHPPKDNNTAWYPMQAMSKALVAVRDYFDRSPYKGTPIFVTWSPVHDRGYCNIPAPFSNNAVAQKSLMSFNMPAAKKQMTVFKNSRMRLADVTYMSLLRPDAHLGLNGKDCSHWCLPGVPDNWADVIYNILMGVRRNFS